MFTALYLECKQQLHAGPSGLRVKHAFFLFLGAMASLASGVEEVERVEDMMRILVG